MACWEFYAAKKRHHPAFMCCPARSPIFKPMQLTPPGEISRMLRGQKCSQCIVYMFLFFWCIVSVPLSVYFPTVFVEASLFIPLFQHNHAPLSISLTSWNCQNYICSSSSFCPTSMFRQFTRGFVVCGKIYNVSRLPSGYLRSGPSPREHSVTSPSGEQQGEVYLPPVTEDVMGFLTHCPSPLLTIHWYQ